MRGWAPGCLQFMRPWAPLKEKPKMKMACIDGLIRTSSYIISIILYFYMDYSKAMVRIPTVDGRNPANQLRLVVYPTIYKVLRWLAGFLPSTVVTHGVIKL